MMPSMPRLSTPARSQISSPRVAKISGEAMRIAAAHRLASKMMLMASIRLSPLQAEAREQHRRHHGEQGGRDHHVGDVVGHADRAAHGIGADEHGGDEDRGGDDADRM